LSEEEEDLLTIFKKILEELTKTRESIEMQTKINYEIATQLPLIMYQSINDLNSQLDKSLKLFKWFAEKSTGRTYT